MEKLIFLFILFVLSFNLFAQISNQARIEKFQHPKDSTLQYRSFEDFNGDTVAYLEYNFIERVSELYAGMTVQEFMNMLPFPVVSAGIGQAHRGGKNDGIFCVDLYVINEFGKKTVDGKYARLPIQVGVTPNITWDEWNVAITNYDPRDLIKKFTITYAILLKGPLEGYKNLMETRKWKKREREIEEMKKREKEKNQADRIQ